MDQHGDAPPEPPPARAPDREPAPAPSAEPLPELPPDEEAGPEEAKIQAAIRYYQQALEQGPRKAKEVMGEGLELGHARRTQERARSRLNVQSWPDGFQGPRLIALPDDQAAEEVKKQRKKKRERAGNGRRKRNGGGSSPRNEVLAPAP